MEPSSAGRRTSTEIHVGVTCQVQTAENRFGAHILEDLRTFVSEGPHISFDMDFDDEDEEDEDEDEDSDADTAGVADDPADVVDWDEPSGTHTEHADSPQDTEAGHHQLGFPRVARLRCNLTALSQQYNLYFAAYQDKIHVFQPKRAPQILPPPSLILCPRKTKAAKMLGGTLDRNFGHQMNSILVGNLGNLEIVFFAFDDGDVGAYYTHAIARCIRANNGHCHGAGIHRQTAPKEFFHENVGLSAWGLAIHQQSRLLAVSSNRHEVTVFAFATNDNPARGQSLKDDNSPTVWSGQTALELERHFQSRTRTWRIVLPTGPESHNIPSVAFCDDETGYADKVVAFDIMGNTWILDIWKIGSFPILYRPNSTPGVCHQRQGWCVLVLPDTSFRQTRTVPDCLGLPPHEVIRCGGTGRSGTQNSDVEGWLDTTCRLFYVRNLAPDPNILLTQRHQGRTSYPKVHLSTPQSQQLLADLDPATATEGDEDDEDSDTLDSESDADAPNDVAEHIEEGRSAEQRWSALTKDPGPAGSAITDLGEQVHLSRTIVPSFGQTPPLNGSPASLISFAKGSDSRKENTKPIDFAKAEFTPHVVKNLTMLRTTSTDVILQPFDRRAAGIVCKSILTHHNHLGRRNEPWDLHSHYSERISMVTHVPELNLVVAAALNGRVALLTLTKTTQRLHRLSVRRGFRVDWVLPRRTEEEKRLRPLCALHGIAVSPVPDPKAQGLNLHGEHGRLAPVQYRLILHYMDHTILTYDIARRAGNEDLMIF